MKKRLQEINLSDIKTDPVGDELVKSARMKPYVDCYVAAMNQRGLEAAVQRVADLELKDRYLWRVAAALQWAFGDFDGETAKLDWNFMSEEQRAEVSELLKRRLIQLSYLVRDLYGIEEANRRIAEVGQYLNAEPTEAAT